jgi:phospholipid-binding lipoprotein MlaA
MLLFIFIVAGCAHSPRAESSPPVLGQALADAPGKTAFAPVLPVSDAAVTPQNPSEQKDDPFHDEYVDDEDDARDLYKDEKVSIADPIEPFNRAMFLFNDKMYFWVLKPAATGYNAVFPEPGRIGVKNFFDHLGYPARVLSCLLQVDVKGAATETGRFVINTLWGLGGFLDPAAGESLNLQKQDTDLGQTLGVYGVGHGFFIMWPVYGPSSPRDSMTIVGDHFLYAPSYIDPWYAWFGVWSYEKINAASLRIGDYESLKAAAIDPYIAMRDAYIQYRMQAVKVRQQRSLLFSDAAGETASKE